MLTAARRWRLDCGRAVMGVLLAGCAWLAFWTFWGEPESLTVRTFAVESPSWRAAPLRVAFISDIHVDGAHMPARRVAAIAAKAAELHPDIIVLGGDYIG